MTQIDRVKEILYQYDWEDNPKREIIENSNVSQAICQLIDSGECPECKGNKTMLYGGKVPHYCYTCQGTGRIPKSANQDAINKYNSNEISFERMCELLGINYYSMVETCQKRLTPY